MSDWYETDAGSVCPDCWHDACRPPLAALCDRSGCCCPCRDRDGGRARELDDRPAQVLDGLARDMAAERYASPVAYRYNGDALIAERLPTLEELRAERWGVGW